MPDTGPTSERLEALQERWASDKGSRVFLQLADEYRRLGRPGDAVRVLEEGLAENPRYPAAQVALGRCRLDLGRATEAAETLERVVESDPTQMVAYRLLVDAYVAQGKPQEARQRLRIYSLLNDSDPDIAELRRRIGQLERQDRPNEEAASPAAPDPGAEGDLEAAPVAAMEGESSGTGVAAPSGEPAGPAGAALAEEPFPDLSLPPETWRGEPEEDLFGLASAPPAPGDARSAGEPFDLDLTTAPSPPDLSSLLEGESPPREAPPESGAELLEGEDPGDEAAQVEPVFGVGEVPPEGAPPPGAPAGEEPAAVAASEAPDAEGSGVDRETGRPTVTLGLLYLRQGHTREAEEIFRAVLERDPDNLEALRHLEEIGEQIRAELAEPRRLTASDLLEGWHGEAGTTQRKRHVLERYRERIREGARRDVH